MDVEAVCQPVPWSLTARPGTLAMPLPDVTLELAGDPRASDGGLAARVLFTFVPRARAVVVGESFMWGDTAFSGDADRAWVPGRIDRSAVSAAVRRTEAARALCEAFPEGGGVEGALSRERWLWALGAVTERDEEVIMMWVELARADEPADVRKSLARYEKEPEVGLVQRWAAEAAHADPRAITGLLRDAKLAALLPQVDAEYKRSDGWDKAWDYYPLDGQIDEPSDAVKVYDVASDTKANQDLGWSVKATWHLDEWLVSSNRVRAVAAAQDLVELRAQLVQKVTDHYFERRKLQIKMDLLPETDLKKRLGDEVELRRLTAMIDGLTDGRFSAALARQQ
jgi:hypothetical protein